ncbi:non-ribosomal peptide synthetase, partial [Ralstonia solanacearum]|uniref:non-ribosomal peptide synthetase n=2 Tax=Ralstonia solanacearum TaxID=305 RepID=UPI0023052A6E
VGPEWKSIPYGRPLANQQFYVLDAFAHPVPIGAVGELYIGGEGVAQGYLNRPELNAERFIADPFRPDANTKLYRTGDLGRYLPDGNIEFLGRIDSQVKIRGFRVELGEIETALALHPDVREAVVLTRGDQAGKQLAAYVVPRDAMVLAPDCVGVYARRMRRHLQDRLPDYMVPSSIHFLAAFPMTPNGKLDRNALLALQADETSHEQDIPMDASSVEQKLESIWLRMLEIPAVGIDENFFDLGGHSLLAIAVADAIQREHGFELPPALVFRHPTIRSLAQSLRQMAVATA